jgi:hypothetical protein
VAKADNNSLGVHMQGAERVLVGQDADGATSKHTISLFMAAYDISTSSSFRGANIAGFATHQGDDVMSAFSSSPFAIQTLVRFLMVLAPDQR